jgi:hypothetical protein
VQGLGFRPCADAAHHSPAVSPSCAALHSGDAASLTRVWLACACVMSRSLVLA